MGSSVHKNSTVQPTTPYLPGAAFTSLLILCPSNHTAHVFLVCDAGSACWGQPGAQFGTDSTSYDIPSLSSCPVAGWNSLPPSYSCAKGRTRVPYTFVCDHRSDCSDDSDESFCEFPPCKGHKDQQCGRSKQCYQGSQFCDGQAECVNEEDEVACTFVSKLGEEQRRPPPPPAVIDFLKNGRTAITPLHSADSGHWSSLQNCPDTHYQCAHHGYCLPTYTRCNDYYDCPDHEDEANCDSYTCPHHYRCFDSRVCVHPSQLCDGIYQCPRSEDELLCDFHCPQHCTCHGLAFTCPRPFPAQEHPELRYLNVRGSGMTLSQLAANTMLIFLSVADCHLHNASTITLPNLITLDLSINKFVNIPHHVLLGAQNLKTLFVSKNPIVRFLPKDADNMGPFEQIQTLDLSITHLYTLDQQLVSLFPAVTLLNLSHSRTQRVIGPGFQPMRKLHILDMKGCPMTEMDKELLKGLNQLHTIYADNYKLCCAASLLLHFDIKNCRAQRDEISSCHDLLQSNAYRACLAVFSGLGLLGNGVSFVFRLFSLQRSGSQGFSVFVLHLCVSDFLMGVYLTMIGVADMFYQNRYVWEDTTWRHSGACQLSGFLSLVSCEVSALIICLITLDRWLVVHFPLSFLHFGGWSAQLASCLSWLAGFILAVVPLLPAMAHWEFYSQTGICIPLPVTSNMFAGHAYSFGIIIILNFILFLIIASGQLTIYLSIRSNTFKQGVSARCSQDTSIARRLFSVAMSDFLCWFPIGLLGLLASQGVPVSGELNVVLAIVVMPLNSALNPFLYTLNILLERQRQRREEKLLSWLKSRG